MALQINYTDPQTRTPHSSSYWRIGSIVLDNLYGTAVLLFSGFHDKAASDAGANPIANHSYELRDSTASDFLLVSKTGKQNNGNANNLHALGYTVAKSTKDTASGTFNPDGTPVMKGFFDGATNV